MKAFLGDSAAGISSWAETQATHVSGNAKQDDPRDGVAVLLDRKHYVMQKAEAERLEAEGVEFAYLFDPDLPDGRNSIITVPVNN